MREKILKYLELRDYTIPELINERDNLFREIVTWFEDHRATHFKTDEGVLVEMRSPKCFARFDKVDTRRAHQWLKDTGNGALLREGVHSGTFSKVVLNMISEGKKLPDFIKVSWKPSVWFHANGWIPPERGE